MVYAGVVVGCSRSGMLEYECCAVLRLGVYCLGVHYSVESLEEKLFQE